MKTTHFLLATLLALVLATGGGALLHSGFWSGQSAEAEKLGGRVIIDFEQYEDAVVYSYLGDKLPEKIVPDEVPEMRTPNSYTRQVAVAVDAAGAKHPTLQTIVYTQPTYAQNTNGDWYIIEHATTTQEAWDQRLVPFAHRLRELIVHTAYADTFYAGAGDGYAARSGGSVNPTTAWNNAHDNASGTSAQPSLTTTSAQSYLEEDGGTYTANMFRAALPFDTSAICSSGSVTAATLSIYVTSKQDGDNDAQAYITVSTSTTASNTTLVVGDYSKMGLPSTSAITTEVISTGERKDITGISSSAYLTFTLNAAGLTAVKVSGASSTCGSSLTGWTCLAVREGHDAEDSKIDTPPAATAYIDSIVFSTSEETGTSQDPYLSVTYTGCAAAATDPSFWEFQDF